MIKYKVKNHDKVKEVMFNNFKEELAKKEFSFKYILGLDINNVHNNTSILCAESQDENALMANIDSFIVRFDWGVLGLESPFRITQKPEEAPIKPIYLSTEDFERKFGKISEESE